ncbi:MAG: hypothetical protein SFV54_28025 [Bryobacteraceae bacterium]|nr:hypothetical protein [Bryobacteraceae bacterium]
MSGLILLLSAVSFAAGSGGGNPASAGPTYTASSLVNAATNLPGPLAPNTIASLYGTGLAWGTRAITGEDLRGGYLPTRLIGSGVVVHLARIAAPLYYVSPTQINLLVPSSIQPGEYVLQTTLDGRAGPEVRVTLLPAAPGLFLSGAEWAVATRPDGTVVDAQSPARPGEVIVFYATGLGPVTPRVADGELPERAAVIVGRKQFVLRLNGVPVNDDRILYVGVTPGFAGLYQINVALPEDAPDDPEVEIQVGDYGSPRGPKVALRR